MMRAGQEPRSLPGERTTEVTPATRSVRGPAPPGRLRRLAHLLLGPPAPARVPARVAEAIRRDQDGSELIVSCIQLLAVATFATLYSLAPKAFPPDVPFEPVPIALAAYTLFTLVRFALALRGRLGTVFLCLSVVMDVALLMVTIWSFHLQYQAPPAIYLKAPTLMYIFILIALRALRFEPGYVILCGLAGAAGWLLLLAYAVVDQSEMEITRDYLEYTMSFKILLGAEFDKVVSILMVTAILALTLHRARKLMIRAAIEHQATRELSRFFAPEVAGRIAATDEALVPGRAELREAAVLYVDLRGFTPTASRLEPAEVMALLSEYQTRMVAAIRSCGGSIDKFMGDGILASFGVAREADGFAREALLAVEELLAAGEAWHEERRERGLPAPEVVAAAAAGRVMFGTVGDAQRLEYTVIGEPVNLAAKLEKHCRAETVRAIVPFAMLERACAQGYAGRRRWKIRRNRAVAGVDRPLDLAVLP